MLNRIKIFNEVGDEKVVDSSNYNLLDLQFSFIRKIEWEFKNDVNVANRIKSYYPFFEKNLISVIYRPDNTDNPHPNNLVIYNADKSIHKIISVPPFINAQTIKENIHPKNELGKFEVLESIERIDEKEHLIVLISTETHHIRWGLCPMIEKRALNIETWEWDPTWSIGGIYWG